jgi:4-amino-4-deoxy-L-arabinose transferase-like glycosyltransferase
MGKLKRLLPAAALLGLCALIFSLRLHTYDEPLERDLTTYAVIAHEMLNGKNLYSDLWDHKPPAIHVTYAAAELIAGYGRNSIFLMNVAAAIATLVACYFAGSAGGRGPLGGLIAATLWTLASGDLAIEGNQPNTEVFLNALLTTAFAILVRSGKDRVGIVGALIVGLLFAIASLYKQIVIVQAALLALAYFACSHPGDRKRAVTNVAIIGLTGAAIWGAVLFYFFARGSGSAFLEAIFTYNRYYSALGWQESLREISAALWIEIAAVLFSMAALTVVGVFHGLIFGPRRQWILLVAFGIATQIAVSLPGWFFRHYFQLWLPPLVIGAGWTVALLKSRLPVRFSPLAYATGVTCCSILIAIQAPDYLVPADVWSAKKYGDVFLETDELARKFDNLLSPDETFYEWGNESGLYFTSRRRPPSGIIFAFPMLAGPLKAKLSARLIDDLNRAKPDLIVADIPTMALTQRGHPVLNWFKEHYRTFARTDEFLFFARKGSRLDGHAGAPPAN